MGGASIVLVTIDTPVRASSCDQGGSLIAANWTITTAQTCIGIVYTVDGSVTINAGGSLTLIDGGLSFVKDTSHVDYALTVNGGGELVLDHSNVTVQTRAIAPYLKLALNVTGAGSRFMMTNGATLKFPGWFNATDATISITDSRIVGFTNTELAGTGVYQDDNNDSAVISWASTTASVYSSQITQLYENWTARNSGNVSGIVEGNVSLSAGSALYAYDSYIGVDFSNLSGVHNELQVDDTSAAYLYNVTIDPQQNPAVETSWKPAFVASPGGRIDLLRWLRAKVVDATGFPVDGATIWSTLSPSATTAQYPDNGLSPIPSAATLSYLGRTASGPNAWNRTDLNGLAVIPLYTDEITSASLPNADSFGNYHLAVAYGASNASGGVAFNPYPAVAWEDNNAGVTLVLGNVQVRTPPDLALLPSDYPGTLSVTQNQSFVVHVLIYNQGQTNATNVSIAAFLDGNRSAQAARVDGLAVALFLNETVNVTGLASLGTHTLTLVVDPDNAINEGGVAQESNNFANLTVDVLPPPTGFVAILTPDVGQALEPGTSLSVTGYVRDLNTNPIVGVTLTIELRSGTTVLATNRSTSGTNGFFVGRVTVPGNAPDGSYTVVVTPSPTGIQSDSRTIAVQTSKPFLTTLVPFLGIPWWLFLIILATAAAIVIGVTLYFKVYGLGKMVECGECGAFIHVDATRCPKCGVEFENDMAKCSNCQAWIPVDIRECPECGVEFTTGGLGIEDYQEKMRLQYEEVVQKLREELEETFNRPLSDQEFKGWWRKQPTFLTFEDWLREEEEVRKKGSKPCPRCGTLNAMTAKVCHQCGSPMTALTRRDVSGNRILTSRRTQTPPTAERPASEVAKGKGQAKDSSDKPDDEL